MRSGKLAVVVIAWALEFAWVSSSLAGVADSPLPTLTPGGPPAQFLFSVPGVMRLGNLETEFTCTSLSTGSVTFAVELFGSTGGMPSMPLNDVTTGNGRATLAPGATLTIATGGTAGLHEDSTISGLPGIKNGSARIVSESKAIECTAYVADKFGTPRCCSFCTNPGQLCTPDVNRAAANCGGAADSCRTTPDSMLELKLISKTKQRGE